MPHVVFILTDGSRAEAEFNDGDSVMDCSLDNNVPGIIGQCGGACNCCTCHCYIASPWAERLPPAQDDEAEMLEYVYDHEAHSRLGCQVRLDASLDGIEVALPPRQV